MTNTKNDLGDWIMPLKQLQQSVYTPLQLGMGLDPFNLSGNFNKLTDWD
jgi:hypothetical protein